MLKPLNQPCQLSQRVPSFTHGEISKSWGRWSSMSWEIPWTKRDDIAWFSRGNACPVAWAKKTGHPYGRRCGRRCCTHSAASWGRGKPSFELQEMMGIGRNIWWKCIEDHGTSIFYVFLRRRAVFWGPVRQKNRWGLSYISGCRKSVKNKLQSHYELIWGTYS